MGCLGCDMTPGLFCGGVEQRHRQAVIEEREEEDMVWKRGISGRRVETGEGN